MSGGRAQRGFTLIELAAVVVVIALLYGFVVPNLGIGSRRTLDGEAEGLRAALELARQRAIATGVRQRVALDLDRARFHLEQLETPPPAEPAPRDPRQPVDLSAPRTEAGSFQPLRSRHGRDQTLADGVLFGSVETEEGIVETGSVAVDFWQDGSSGAARIVLANRDGDAIELQVLPLADAVRIHAIP